MSKTNLEVAKECGASTLQEHWQLYPYRISFGHEELDAYTSRICAEKEANAQEYISLLDNQKQRLEQQLSEANARIAMKDEALKEAAARMRYFDFNLVPESIRIVDEAILASTESVAAWEAEKLLPMKRQVAMQLEIIVEMRSHEGRTLVQNMADKAISYTQSTAEAYYREHAVKVLEEVMNESLENKWIGQGVDKFASYIAGRIAELRAANKKDGELYGK